MDTSKQVRGLFRNAGWYENRKVKVENPSRNLKSAHENAIAVLEQYGGLKVGEVKAGRELSAGDISFMTNPYEFNQSYNKQWPNLNTTFFVFASAHNEHMLLMVDDNNIFYIFTDPDEQLYKVGSFNETVRRVLLGIDYGRPLERA